jgi:ABC-type transporter Mla subunit MlaD
VEIILLLLVLGLYALDTYAIHHNNKKWRQIMADLESLTAQVEQNNTVIGSALALINGFAAQLAAAGTDPAKLQALQDSLKAQDDQLAEAVAKNTPAANP